MSNSCSLSHNEIPLSFRKINRPGHYGKYARDAVVVSNVKVERYRPRDGTLRAPSRSDGPSKRSIKTLSICDHDKTGCSGVLTAKSSFAARSRRFVGTLRGAFERAAISTGRYDNLARCSPRERLTSLYTSRKINCKKDSTIFVNTVMSPSKCARFFLYIYTQIKAMTIIY